MNATSPRLVCKNTLPWLPTPTPPPTPAPITGTWVSPSRNRLGA